MDKKIKFVVFLGKLPGPTYYAERFIDYLKKRSIDYYIVNVNIPETYQSPMLDEFADSPGTIVFAMNNVGLGLNFGGINFWKDKNIPVIDYIVDHPRFFADSMLDPVCDLYVFTLDKDHRDYIKRFYPKVKDAVFSPNGGTAVNSGLKYRDREIDVLYMGSCNYKISDFPIITIPQIGDNTDFYKGVLRNLFSDPMLPTEAAIELYLEKEGIIIEDEQKLMLSTEYAPFIENYVRRYYKLEGMKALDEAGVHVEVYGDMWEDEEYRFSDNIHINERIGIEELMDLIGHAKISLCFIPWFKRGCSEKNFDSMLNGALCVSDRSEYLEEHYRDGDNIVYFDLNNPKQMAADIRWLLDNPDSAEMISKRGYDTAVKYDTWDRRYEALIDYAYKII